MLSLIGVGHHYPRSPWLFRGLEWSFQAGTSTAVVGPSGSGKTTLLGILGGLFPPAEGAVWSTGIEQVSWIFQTPSLLPRRRVLDNVALPCIARGLSRRDAESKASQLLAEVGLSGHVGDPTATLSGGEGQRACLARALAGEPDILLADEPTASLDPVSAEPVFEAVRSAARGDLIVVVATHDTRLAAQCDQVLELGSPV